MGKRYYWLKLQEDFFDSKRIKKLRRVAGGDTYVIIYLKMQLIAMKNDGYISYTGLENSFAEELALELDEDVDNVSITLQYLSNTELIQTSDNVNFFLPYSVENTGSEGASAKRVRDCRERKVLQVTNDVTEKKKPQKHKYGEYKNVLLTDEELEKLKATFPSDWSQKIENMSSAIEMKGYKYKSHYLAILKWSKNDKGGASDVQTDIGKYQQTMYFPDEG